MSIAPKILIAAAFLMLVQSLPAQPEPQDEAALRAWFQSLPAERRARLMHRQRVYNRMPPQRKLEVLDAARAGKPILTEQERETMRRVREMRGPERMRLLALSHELRLLRRMHGPEVEAALQLEGPERAQRIRELLRRHRAREYVRQLPDEQRQRLQSLPAPERNREMTRQFVQESRERREALIESFPQISELRARAREGDEAARTELRRALGDIRTLDMMLQRLQPQARERVHLADLSIEEAFETLRQELRRQAMREARERPHRQGPRGPNPQGPRHEDNLRPGDERRPKGNRQGR